MDHIKKKIYESFTTVWENIPVTIKYCKAYWISASVGHLEIKAEQPLPITETGYRSIWIMPGMFEDTDPVQYVLDGLNEMAQKKQWKHYLEQKKAEELAKSQLRLF